jgi:hypothetical protein
MKWAWRKIQPKMRWTLMKKTQPIWRTWQQRHNRNANLVGSYFSDWCWAADFRFDFRLGFCLARISK